MAPPPEVFYRLPLIEHLIFFAFFHPDFHLISVFNRSRCRQIDFCGSLGFRGVKRDASLVMHHGLLPP